MQDGLNHKDPKEPALTTARIYRELGTLLRLDKDKFRLSEIEAYLDTRFPRQFDDPEYWLLRSANKEWNGEPKETARKMLVYSINGDISIDERLELLEALYEFDLRGGDSAHVNNLKAYIKEYDRSKRPRINDERSDAFGELLKVGLSKKNGVKPSLVWWNFSRSTQITPTGLKRDFYSVEHSKKFLAIFTKQRCIGI